MDAQQPTRISRAAGAVVVAVALAVGWPALDGSYDSGDDKHLIFNHGLVNRPSFEHALELFEIIHRDLYQPIPLLTFQIEFALHEPAGDSPDRLARLLRSMHRTNLLIHALNGLLVLVLFTRLLRQPWTAWLISLMFVCHPLSVECYAWLNGRMIMLSTTFALLALLALLAWRRAVSERTPQLAGSAWGWGATVLLCVTLAMMCKVRPGLVVLAGLLLLWPQDGRRWFDAGVLRRAGAWLLLVMMAAVTAVFIAVNWQATAQSRMFEGAEQQLFGPNLARVFQTLAWYAIHYVWPFGLAPWYAPPTVIAWSNPEVLLAITVVVLCALAALASLRWTAMGIFGSVWFLATVAATLPFVPARNLLAADRYVYLSNVGLHWILAGAVVFVVRRGHLRMGLVRWTIAAAAVLLIGWSIVSRRVCGYYHDDESRIVRMIEVSPDHATLLTSWGWYFYEQGDYASAIQKADEELARFGDDDTAYCRAMCLRGMSRFRLSDDLEGAIDDLQAALQRVPDYVKGYNRLGIVYHQAGRFQEAEHALTTAVELSDGQFNPAIKLLASLKRREGCVEEAQHLYRLAVDNSMGFDVEAINALGEIDIEGGRLLEAVRRYRDLLAWDSRAVTPRINMAIALAQLGRLQEAAGYLVAALRLDPGVFEASFNLALVYERMQRFDAALEAYVTALQVRPGDRRALAAASALLRRARRAPTALALWRRAVQDEPGAADLWAGTALNAWFAAQPQLARQAAGRALALQPGQAEALLAVGLVAMSEGQPEAVFQAAEQLASVPVIPAAVYEYGYQAAESHAVVEPASPWPYHVTAVLLGLQGRHDVAELVLRDFDRRCTDETYRQRLRALVADNYDRRPPQDTSVPSEELP